MKAIRFETTGGPEVLRLADVGVGEPGPGTVRVRHSAIGVNFIDTYHRRGLYPLPLPSGLGLEAAGTVEALGEGVTGLSVGDRVVYFAPTPGSYATHRIVPADWLVKLPAVIDEGVAAALWLKACTVEFLVERCARVRDGDPVLVHAAAGGVGLLLTAWLKAIGATVIATVGSEAKRPLAEAAGAQHVLAYGEVPARVRELTGGEGVSVVFDGVGKATFEPSLDSLRRRGLHVCYGNASGAVGPVDFAILARKGSLFATRPTLFDYYATPEDRAAGFAAVLARIADGTLRAHIGGRYPLAEAARAHADLEARATTGSLLLIP